MTEELVQQLDAEQVVPSSVTAYEGPAKMTQEEMNELIRARQKVAFEKGRQEALAQMKPSQSINPEDLEKKMREVAAEVQYETTAKFHVEQTIKSLHEKAQIAANKYPDFEQKVQRVGLGESPALVAELAKFDNAGDIMYEFGLHPHKFTQLANALERTPSAAKVMLAELSESITNNQKAQSTMKTPSEPVSQIKPSANIGGDSDKPKSIADFKKASWARF